MPTYVYYALEFLCIVGIIAVLRVYGIDWSQGGFWIIGTLVAVYGGLTGARCLK